MIHAVGEGRVFVDVLLWQRRESLTQQRPSWGCRKEGLTVAEAPCARSRYLHLILKIGQNSVQQARPLAGSAQVNDGFLFTGPVCFRPEECRNCAKVDAVPVKVKNSWLLLDYFQLCYNDPKTEKSLICPRKRWNSSCHGVIG